MFIISRYEADDTHRPLSIGRPCGRFGANARGTRRGLTAAELVVVVVIIVFAALFFLMSLPRQRERARLSSCRDNLRLIGVALLQYDQRVGCLPTVASLSPDAVYSGGSQAKQPLSPLAMLLQELGMPDLRGIDDPQAPPRSETGARPTERVISGFLCPSDSNATGGLFPAPVSYRATTGPTADGRGGVFEIGRRVSLDQVESGDGKSYTVGFCERLVGDKKAAKVGLETYFEVPGPIGDEGCDGTDASSPRGDAGGTWLTSNWRSTLYNHVLIPGAMPSCIARDGSSASMSASSGHLVGVNALVLDGGVRTFTTSVDRRIWRAWSTIDEESKTQPTADSNP